MSTRPVFNIPDRVSIHHGDLRASRCYAYAVAEAARLMGRLGVHVDLNPDAVVSGAPEIVIVPSGATRSVTGDPNRESLAWDGYRLRVADGGIAVTALSAKGLLNGVYDLAERLGFLFLLPGDSGEWPPLGGPNPLPIGEAVMNPRFPHRGVAWQSLDTKDYTVEEWLRFYAKLRFNSVFHDPVDGWDIAPELGLRYETGGHVMQSLLPRDRFERTPDLFRMSQPEDFGGKRTDDANFCPTHPETKAIVKESYRERINAAPGVYAYHAWPSDLPGGGWCFCPRCRSLSPAVQAMLATRHLAEVVAEEGVPMRVPFAAYQDTLYPGGTVETPGESFLLFAPRERCYGHALDDPACERNRFYLEALKACMDKFSTTDDAHTVEYYFDQILYRGMYPFLPETILKDMAVYERHGIETHTALQVGGPAVAPEYNMLVFAQGLWNADLTAEAFVRTCAVRIAGRDAEVWERYLTSRKTVFAEAMRMCGYPQRIWTDFRWLPERADTFGETMADAYAAASKTLDEAAADLVDAMGASWPDRLKRLTEREANRARFEAAELNVMALQQRAMNGIGRYLSEGCVSSLECGLHCLEEAIVALETARHKAEAACLPPGTWYFGINSWLKREFEEKCRIYKGLSRADAVNS